MKVQKRLQQLDDFPLPYNTYSIRKTRGGSQLYRKLRIILFVMRGGGQNCIVVRSLAPLQVSWSGQPPVKDQWVFCSFCFFVERPSSPRILPVCYAAFCLLLLYVFTYREKMDRVPKKQIQNLIPFSWGLEYIGMELLVGQYHSRLLYQHLPCLFLGQILFNGLNFWGGIYYPLEEHIIQLPKDLQLVNHTRHMLIIGRLQRSRE